MNDNHSSPNFKKWLDTLQQESWQLELIVSGFAIYGLIQSLTPIVEFFSKTLLKIDGDLVGIFVALGGSTLLISIYALIVCLVVHVILRGLWIGAIGLRYVSGDVDISKLKYSPKFTLFLKKRIVSFDKYIATLEDYCSLIFAVSFLLVFFCISFFASFFVLIGVTTTLMNSEIAEGIKIVGAVLCLVLFLIYILSFIDFVGQGILKRRRWTTRFYFPIYRMMSIITLSFLYRPLLYNLLDNRLGKKVLYLLIPGFILAIFLYNLRIEESNFHNAFNKDSSLYASSSNYGDEIVYRENELIKTALIPSKTIATRSLDLFVVHKKAIEDAAIKRDSLLKSGDDIRGLASFFSRGAFSKGSFSSKVDNRLQVYLSNLNEIISIEIDSIHYPSDFIAATSRTDQRGYATVLNLDSLSEGRHLLSLKRASRNKKDSLVHITIANIPFWYYPN